MPAVSLSRVGARVVESGPDGQELAAGAWQKLEAVPDPRSPRGRIYPLACLIAVALCAFTAAGNDRLTAAGQWIKRASQADLARLRAPWDPMAGRYRAPDERGVNGSPAGTPGCRRARGPGSGWPGCLRRARVATGSWPVRAMTLRRQAPCEDGLT